MSRFEEFELAARVLLSYAEDAELDKFLGMERPADVDRLMEIIKDESRLRYFLHNLRIVEWLDVFIDRGLFATPPEPKPTENGGTAYPYWALSRLLIRYAADHPETVLRAISRIGYTKNVQVVGDILEAGINMPVESGVTLVPLAIQWSEDADLLILGIPSTLARFAEGLAPANSSEALHIIGSLLALNGLQGETPGYSDVAVQGYTSTQLKNMAEPVISFSTFSSLPVMARVELIERSQGDWGTPDIVDTLGGPGLFMDTSLALDSNQVPKLAYYRDVYSRDLRFAELVGQDWNAITVDDGGGDELVGQYASLALDQSERPLIGYHHYNNGTHVSKLKIAYRADGSCWYIEELPVGTGSVGDVSLKLFSDWNPAVAFEQAEPYAGWHLWYARYW